MSLGDIEENESKVAIQAWIERMNKCIQAKGCFRTIMILGFIVLLFIVRLKTY